MAIVSNPASMKLVKARLIFDSSSQRTYILSRLRDAFALPFPFPAFRWVDFSRRARRCGAAVAKGRAETNVRRKQVWPAEGSLGVYADAKAVYHCQGRLENSALPYEMKYPALLPAKSHLTSLIARGCYKGVMHRGIKDTLTELWSCYWLSKGRQVVKHQLRNCVFSSV